MDIKKEISQLTNLIPKDKAKKILQLAHKIVSEVTSSSFDKENIDLYIALLNQAIKYKGFPGKFLSTRAKLIKEKLALTGDDKAAILQKKNFILSIESGVISVNDSSYEKTITHANPETFIELINEGQMFAFYTGGDGTYDIQLRLIQAYEPVLSMKEYKLVTSSTDTVTISIPTGAAAVCDSGMYERNSNASLDIPPGNYKVCIYSFDTRKNFKAYYIVLCPTTDLAVNNISQIYNLDLD